MSIFNEFKDFSVKGNVIDLAVGVIIGGAFGSIVKSLVDDIIMPPLGLVIGGVDFSNFFIILKDGTKQVGPYVSVAAAKQAGAVTLNIGLFINALVSFFIVAFAIFMLIKAMNRFKNAHPSTPDLTPETKSCAFCFTSIPKNATRCPNCTSHLPE